MKKYLLAFTAFVMLTSVIHAQSKKSISQATTTKGVVAGVAEASGVTSFKGIPYAAPPVGKLRWREPQPVANWTGVLKTDKFGPMAMQPPIFGDMNFRSNGMSEDCLYLNVWTPAKSAGEKLPVLVYFYGGGFIAGDGSEPRYDGESMATKGIVALTVNYRLGLFGFYAHPDLSAESGHQASGNYGVMDQWAALRWVKENIAAFGGDPARVTIAGESAGSVSVCAQMASPLSKNLFAGAIGESGSMLGTLPAVPLKQAEQTGMSFAKLIGAGSLEDLRKLSADSLLKAASAPGALRFSMTVDGYFFPKDPHEIFAKGEQAKVPLLAGWNSQEGGYQSIIGNEAPTIENFTAGVKKLYGDKAERILAAYKPSTNEEVEQVATDLAGDRFIGFSTWKWIDEQQKTGQPVYRYYYEKPRPAMTPEMGDASPGLAGGVDRTKKNTAPPAKGAVHSAEIEYAMGNLATNKVFAWTNDDYKVSATLQAYFVNFIKNGNPNGAGLPQWPSATGKANAPVMHINVASRLEDEKHRDRYVTIDALSSN